MYNDLKQLYWWLGMKRDISEFVSRCLVCQQVQAEHQVPSSLFQSSDYGFVSGLPLSPKKKDAIWVVVDRLTKSIHFILITQGASFDYFRQRSEVYVAVLEEITRSFSTKLNFNTAFHLQTDGQSERVLQILEDML
ncbi:DNA/RNA polymerases superfamily protein [Gossypium australe]|uniref:DNA/RNA polymerases superfamily protein n=1 Tax=Gossypium australe TaxID=47621 RepID=A0A5B6W0Z8_9ROSI|nr:DNA/RNA polymerases superfamily protein [Gossypium australe]